MNLITSKTHPTAGAITIDGEPVWENDAVLGRVFYMTEANLHPGSLRVREAFQWTAQFYPGFRTAYGEELARRFGAGYQQASEGAVHGLFAPSSRPS
ncbi:MAG: hypothetical protein ACOX53_06145 [Limnochordia bacterium]